MAYGPSVIAPTFSLVTPTASGFRSITDHGPIRLFSNETRRFIVVIEIQHKRTRYNTLNVVLAFTLSSMIRMRTHLNANTLKCYRNDGGFDCLNSVDAGFKRTSVLAFSKSRTSRSAKAMCRRRR